MAVDVTNYDLTKLDVRGDDFAKTLAATILNKSYLSIVIGMKPLKEKIDRVKSLYGKLLYQAGIGVASSPFYSVAGRPTPSWKALSQRWIARKGHSLFYAGLTGNLGEAIKSMPTERLFGDTEVRVSRVGTAKDTGRTDKSGNRVLRYRNERGRFIPKDRYMMSANITIRSFPLFANSEPSEEAVIGALPIGSPEQHKLVYNMRSRPLVKYFTYWFFEEKVRTTIQRHMRDHVQKGVKFA